MSTGNAQGHVCLSGCVCPVQALTSESLDLENLFFLYAANSQEHLAEVCISRSLGQGQGQGHRSQNIAKCTGSLALI